LNGRLKRKKEADSRAQQDTYSKKEKRGKKKGYFEGVLG
jgi:hypothetical protein